MTFGAITFDALPDILINSITLAGGYLMIALAWVLIFRTTGVLNFATGQMVFFGALVFSSTAGAGWAGFALGWGASMAALALFGAAVYYGLLKPIAGEPVFSAIVLTMGLSIALTAVLSIGWGVNSRILSAPVRDQVYEWPWGATTTTYSLAAFIVGILTLVSLLLWFGRSRAGTQMRAAAADPTLASQSGININRNYMLSWAVAGAVLATVGISFGLAGVVSANLISLGLRGIAPALVGGLDSLGGTVVGAIMVALVETLAVTQFGGSAQDAAAFAVLLVVLAIRPYGLFGTPEVRRV